MTARRRLVATAIGVCLASPGAAQTTSSLRGEASVLAVAVPSAPGPAGDRAGAIELRSRLFGDWRRSAGRIALRASGFVDGLVAERTGASSQAATWQPREITATYSSGGFDLSAGIGQVVWGTLDEVQPTDVVNPLDVSRYFLDGRAEARRSVGLVRARAYLPKGLAADLVYVPVFRRGTFDLLQPATSPFSLAPREACAPGVGCVPVVTRDETPAARWRHGQGGGRFSATAGRVDLSVMAWRGFEPLPVYSAATSGPNGITLLGTHPRTAVVGVDAETVLGAWGLRAEAAWHLRDTLQALDRVAAVPARSVEAGLGVDRRAGDYRVSLSALLMERRARQAGGARIDGRDVQLVSAVDRSFAAETRRVRVFAVYNPQDDSAFVRGTASWSPHDGAWIDASVGWLRGTSTDTLSRLADRDFVSVRVTVSF